ncbi:MAG: ATP-binding cassette domain-containing protein, partial [Pseudonocardia sp.]|nr:ATP-binding cassette domain-containing protein [Pseudonocardia sp.]
ALDGVDLTVAAAECVALLGPNGAGKTTLVGLATGLLARQEGSVAVGSAPRRGRRHRVDHAHRGGGRGRPGRGAAPRPGARRGHPFRTDVAAPRPGDHRPHRARRRRAGGSARRAVGAPRRRPRARRQHRARTRTAAVAPASGWPRAAPAGGCA